MASDEGRVANGRPAGRYPAAVVAVVAVLLLRLLLLGEPALVDPSESRFAAAAAHMLASGDFVTPRINAGGAEWEPYWAKPPLHMWAVALSLGIFGTNEFAARLPSFVGICLSALAVVSFARRHYPPGAAAAACLVYLSFLGVYLFQPAVLTDSSLAACVSWALVWFYRAVSAGGDRRAGIACAAALAAGLLVKGPVAVALFSVTAAPWLVWSGAVRRLPLFPWGPAVAVVAAAALPWYLAAERATPGFLRYFLLEENVFRYVRPDAAIRYGTLHSHFRGMIWPMAAAVASPWSVVFLAALGAGRPWKRPAWDDRGKFVACWALGGLCFFTFARQVLPTYTFSALPGLSLAVGHFLTTPGGARTSRLLAAPTVLSVLRAAAAAAAVAGAACGLPWSGAAVLVAVVACRLWDRSPRDETALPRFVTHVCVAACAGLVAASPWIGDVRSSRSVVKAAGSAALPGDRVIELFADVHSVRFYGAREFRPGVTFVAGAGPDDLASPGRTHVLIQKRDLDKLPPDALEGFGQAGVAGRWRYYVRGAGNDLPGVGPDVPRAP